MCQQGPFTAQGASLSLSKLHLPWSTYEAPNPIYSPCNTCALAAGQVTIPGTPAVQAAPGPPVLLVEETCLHVTACTPPLPGLLTLGCTSAGSVHWGRCLSAPPAAAAGLHVAHEIPGVQPVGNEPGKSDCGDSMLVSSDLCGLPPHSAQPHLHTCPQLHR